MNAGRWSLSRRHVEARQGHPRASGVGKTGICPLREGLFGPTRHQQSAPRPLTVEHQRTKDHAADLGHRRAGALQFDGTAHYRGAVAAILVFAVTDEFDKLKDCASCRATSTSCCAGDRANKADLAEQRAVSFETAAQYAATIGALVYETSAKSSTGVDELFNEVARRLVVTRARATETGQPQLPDPLQDAPKSGCC